MVCGVYTKVYNEGIKHRDTVELRYYKSAEEAALINFLDYVQEQENPLVDALSDKSKSLIDRIIKEWISDVRFSELLGLTLLFLRYVSDDLIAEVEKLGNYCFGQENLFLSTEEFERDYERSDTKIFNIKRIIYYSDKQIIRGSKCMIAMPAAFMVRSDRDIHDNLKMFPCDTDVQKILDIVSKNEYYSVEDLNDVVIPLAKVYRLDPEILCAMVQCLLAYNALDLKNTGHLSSNTFEKIINDIVK